MQGWVTFEEFHFNGTFPQVSVRFEFFFREWGHHVHRRSGYLSALEQYGKAPFVFCRKGCLFGVFSFSSGFVLTRFYIAHLLCFCLRSIRSNHRKHITIISVYGTHDTSKNERSASC